jgi:hypothetical protein
LEEDKLVILTDSMSLVTKLHGTGHEGHSRCNLRSRACWGGIQRGDGQTRWCSSDFYHDTYLVLTSNMQTMSMTHTRRQL